MLNPGNAAIVFNYLNQDTDSELLANPRVVATDNVKTRISIAEQYPIPNFSFSEQTASLQISGFEYKDIGIILTVTPRVNRNDYVTLDVTAGSEQFVGRTRRCRAVVAMRCRFPSSRRARRRRPLLIKSGNTLAIGGLMRVDVSDNYTKVPLMGDAPLLGPLFRNKSLSKTKRDLLIFLTPTIVHPDQQTGYEKYANGLPNEHVLRERQVDAERQLGASELFWIGWPRESQDHRGHDQQRLATTGFRVEVIGPLKIHGSREVRAGARGGEGRPPRDAPRTVANGSQFCMGNR